jgi:hypothetical protein
VPENEVIAFKNSIMADDSKWCKQHGTNNLYPQHSILSKLLRHLQYDYYWQGTSSGSTYIQLLMVKQFCERSWWTSTPPFLPLWVFTSTIITKLYLTFNPLKSKLVQILFTNSVCTSKRTQPITITNINLLTPIKKIIYVYTENHTEPINTKCRVTDCSRCWYI